MIRSIVVLLTLVLAIIFLSGCVTLSDPESSQEFSKDMIGTVDDVHAVGQTFVSRRPRLNGVEFWLTNPVPAPTMDSGTLVIELYHDRQEPIPLFSQHLAVESIPTGYPVRAVFSPQDDPPDQHYYLRLEASGASIDVLGRNEDAYPRGKAFVDDSPTDADIAFRLLYDYDARAMLDDLLATLPLVWPMLLLAALLLLPGWLLLDLLNLRWRFDAGEQVSLAIGLSVSLLPLALLWTSFVGLRWSRSAVVVGMALLAATAGWRVLRRPGQHARPSASTLRQVQNPSRGWGWALAGIFVLSLAVRLAMVRDLAAPAWVDSVHHALITRLIVDNGALPTTYAPFVTADTASYHAGFHGVVAAFHWLSGLDVAEALLVVGQVFNALMILAAYLLAKEMTGDRATGLVAAMVAGLFSPMPAYYASWGRYTHLAGLLILPAAFTLARRGMISRAPCQEATSEGDAARKRCLALATVAMGGLILTHYRVAAFFGCLLLAYLVGQRYGRGTRLQHLVDDCFRLGLIGGGAVILTLPWLVPTATTLWLPKLDAWSKAEPSAYLDFSWAYLTLRMGKHVLVLASVGLVWALLRRQRFVLTLATWVGLLFLLASPGLVGLPGGGFVNFVSVEISLFLPLSILAGYAASQLLAILQVLWPIRWKTLSGAALALSGISLALFGARTLLPVLNMDTVLYRQVDDLAMAWIRENTPDDARFLVNPMLWSPHMHAGYDGGYWIGPLAGRQTVPPPVLYGFGSGDEIQAINEKCATVIEQGDAPDTLWPLLRGWGITHIYIGARGGVLSAKALAESELYHPVYSRGGTAVFEVLP